MKKAEKIANARIQRAITGFRIPLLTIPPLYKALEAAIVAGKTDAELREVTRAFPAVEVAP